jgi:hypothetical protein
MKTKLKAILIGGPSNGQTFELDEANPEISIASRVLERNGKWRVLFTSKYKLKSSGQTLKYEFDDSN